jgi:hypothetical protein
VPARTTSVRDYDQLGPNVDTARGQWLNECNERFALLFFSVNLFGSDRRGDGRFELFVLLVDFDQLLSSGWDFHVSLESNGTIEFARTRLRQAVELQSPMQRRSLFPRGDLALAWQSGHCNPAGGQYNPSASALRLLIDAGSKFRRQAIRQSKNRRRSAVPINNLRSITIATPRQSTWQWRPAADASERISSNPRGSGVPPLMPMNASASIQVAVASRPLLLPERIDYNSDAPK